MANELILATQLNNALIISCCDRDFWKRPFRLYLLYLSSTFQKHSTGILFTLTDLRNALI